MGVVNRRWLWMESMDVVVRRYIDFLILLIPTTRICSFWQQYFYFFVHFIYIYRPGNNFLN